MNVQKTNNLQHLQAAPSTTVKQGNSLFSNAKVCKPYLCGILLKNHHYQAADSSLVFFKKETVILFKAVFELFQ